MDGMKMLKANPTELKVMEALLVEADAQYQKMQGRQADLIARSVSKLFKN